HARLEELDLEGAWTDLAALADQLVHPRLVDGAGAGGLDVEAVVLAGRPAVEADDEARRAAAARRREHEVEVASREAVGDRSWGGVEHRRLRPDRPRSRQRPLVQRQGLAARLPAPFRARTPEVGLGRFQLAPVGCLGETGRIDRGDLLVDAEQSLHLPLGLLV